MGDDIFEIIEVERYSKPLKVAKDVQSEDSRDGVIEDPDSKGFVGDEGVTLEDS